MNELPFVEFPKIARLSREVVVTEKIDGTNAQVCVHEGPMEVGLDCQVNGTLFVRAGSRSRWISIADDNHGFAKWVYAKAYELVALGVGSHFGEWWGSGIQRGYGLPQGEKRFSLFNVGRWIDVSAASLVEGVSAAPACCHVVPVMYEGEFDLPTINLCLNNLRVTGSRAAPGFMNPEGVVIWHTGARIYFKKTIVKDEEYKGKAA